MNDPMGVKTGPLLRPAQGQMVVGQDGGAIGAAPVTDCSPASPHVLFVMKRGETAIEVRLSAHAALRLAQSLVPMTDAVKNADLAIQAGHEPIPPGDE